MCKKLYIFALRFPIVGALFFFFFLFYRKCPFLLVAPPPPLWNLLGRPCFRGYLFQKVSLQTNGNKHPSICSEVPKHMYISYIFYRNDILSRSFASVACNIWAIRWPNILIFVYGGDRIYEFLYSCI